MKRRIFKKLLSYFFLWFLSFFSLYLYFLSKSNNPLDSAILFFNSKLINFVILNSSLFILLYVFGILDFGFFIKEYFFNKKDIINSIWKIFLAFALSLVIENFFYFSDRVGRVLYLIYLFLFTTIWLIDKLILVRYKNKRKRKIGVIGNKIIKDLDETIKKNNDISLLPKGKKLEVHKNINILLFEISSINNDELHDLIAKKFSAIKVEDVGDFIEEENEKISLKFFKPDLFLRDLRKINFAYLKVTRFSNIVISIFSLVLLTPLVLPILLINKLFSPGPIFYLQERVGENGRIFKLIKFRTMKKDAEKYGPKFSSENDSRITIIGKFMRRARVDEVPQFINVLKGDMNIVGPRPEREIFIENLSKKIPCYKLRLFVKPGITGWAQVKSGYAGDNIKEHTKKLEYDLYYIKNRSAILDFIIIIKTFKKIFEFSGK